MFWGLGFVVTWSFGSSMCTNKAFQHEQTLLHQKLQELGVLFARFHLLKDLYQTTQNSTGAAGAASGVFTALDAVGGFQLLGAFGFDPTASALLHPGGA